MTALTIIELAAAAIMIIAGVALYRRPSPDRRGSQGAVLLFLVAAIVIMHALGLFEYRPSAAEIGQ